MAVANGVWRIDSISPEQWGALAGAPCWVTYYDSFQPIRRFLKPGAIRYLRQQSDDTHTIGLYGKSLTKTQEHSQPTQQTDPPFLGEKLPPPTHRGGSAYRVGNGSIRLKEGSQWGKGYIIIRVCEIFNIVAVYSRRFPSGRALHKPPPPPSSPPALLVQFIFSQKIR
jgi:hypothetical protein